jgi:hypothetical protein
MRRSTKKITAKALKACSAGLAILLLASCASTVGVGDSAGSFVSTSVENSSHRKVHAAVKSVFREEGFSLLSEEPNEFHFRKWGGRSTEIIYGSWYTEGVAIEPEVIIFDQGAGNYTVHCDVYMREHNGSELLDANWRLLSAGKSAYRGLMKKIKKRAEGP